MEILYKNHKRNVLSCKLLENKSLKNILKYLSFIYFWVALGLGGPNAC
jgi:hypothetical protein